MSARTCFVRTAAEGGGGRKRTGVVRGRVGEGRYSFFEGDDFVVGESIRFRNNGD